MMLPPDPPRPPAAPSPMRTILPNPRQTPRFAGVCTFCRFPLLELITPGSYSGGVPLDWAVYGVPFDAGVTFRPGARFGPRAIRDASQYVKPYSIDHDINICEVLSLADAGDAPIHPFALKATLDGVCDWVLAQQDTSGGGGIGPRTRFFAVGGDHSIAYANMKAAWIRSGRPAGGIPLIHFDSHLDTVDITGGEKWSHASPFIRAVEDGILDPRRMLSIGIKGPLNSARDLDYAKASGITIVSYSDWRREGTTRIDEFLARLGGTGVYLTFDIDCIDPAFAPGTGTPSVGGFSSAEALQLLRHLAGVSKHGLNLIGADVVEVLPDRDVSQVTAFLAAHIIFEVLCLDALHVRAGTRAAP